MPQCAPAISAIIRILSTAASVWLIMCAWPAEASGTDDSPLLDAEPTSAEIDEANNRVISAEVSEAVAAETVVVRSLTEMGLNAPFQIDNPEECPAFAVDADSGRVTIAQPELLDFETTPQQCVRISGIATAPAPNRFDHAFQASLLESGVSPQRIRDLLERRELIKLQVSITDAPKPPSVADLELTVPESTAPGTLLGIINGTDPDTGETLTYFISEGDTEQLFELERSTGKVFLARDAQLNYEDAECFAFTVVASDSVGLMTTASVIVAVEDVNEAPVWESTETPLTVLNEETVVLGRISASDPDRFAQLTYDIVDGNDLGIFDIDNQSGVLFVRNSDRLNSVNDSAVKLAVDISDESCNTTTATVTINVSLPATAVPQTSESTVESRPATEPDASAARVAIGPELANITRKKLTLLGLSSGVWIFAIVVIRRQKRTARQLAEHGRLKSDTMTLQRYERLMQASERQVGTDTEEIEPTKIASGPESLNTDSKTVTPPTDVATAASAGDSTERFDIEELVEEIVRLEMEPSAQDLATSAGNDSCDTSSSEQITDIESTGQAGIADIFAAAAEFARDEDSAAAQMGGIAEEGSESDGSESVETSQTNGEANRGMLSSVVADIFHTASLISPRPSGEATATEDVVESESADEENDRAAVSSYVSQLMKEITEEYGRKVDKSQPVNGGLEPLTPPLIRNRFQSPEEAEAFRRHSNESLRSSTPLFRELSKQAANAAVASALLRQAQSVTMPRKILLVLLMVTNVIVGIANGLGYNNLSTSGNILLLALFAAAAEFGFCVYRMERKTDQLTLSDKQFPVAEELPTALPVESPTATPNA